MIDSKTDGGAGEASKGTSLWMQRGILGAVCALVIGGYACTAHSGFVTSLSLNPADNYYNLLVQGFRAGQLNLKVTVPPELAELVDPYDPVTNFSRPVYDMSYYKGKLHLYFGVTPVLVLFWPYVALTGHYLPQRDATVIFCLVGFLVSAGLLCALWRRYFAEVRVLVVAAGVLALGLTTCTPFLLARSDVYEVSISCGYALAMLALAAIWKALHDPSRRGRWLVAASMAYGFALGARPSLLFGAAVLLVPVAQAWREQRKIWAPLLAATVPIMLLGLGLMLYNWLRFDNPFEFGIRYQVAGDRRLTRQFFSVRYLLFNLRIYFLELARWDSRFPFVHGITMPPLPAGHGGSEQTFGVLTNIPLVWLGLAVPLAWRGRFVEAGSSLCGFLAAVALLFGIGALTASLYCYAACRFEVEFLPALVLLAVIGILSLERASACQPLRRNVMRWGWGLLMGFSVVFNLLASVERCAEADYNLGIALQRAGQMQEAIGHFEQALRLKPSFAEAPNNLGVVLMGQNRGQEAIGPFEQALRLKPDFAEAHYNLGMALQGAGQMQEAIGHFEQALRLKPDFAEAHYNLGMALQGAGQIQEAIGHFEQALRLKPDFAEAHNNLAVALKGQNEVQEAIGQFEQALRLKPDLAEAHYNLGVVLMGQNRVQEAISHFEQALRFKPDLAEAQNSLARARAVQ